MNKTIISALVVLILLISIPLGIYLIQKNQTLKSRATTSGAPSTIDFYGTQLHMLKLFGQNKITENSRNIVNGKGIYHAAGVVVDKSSRPNKVYVVDSGNSRILGYNGAGVCSNNASQSCTADSDCGSGNSCRIDGTKDPDIVLGHDNLTDGGCNGDNNLGFTKNPSAKTLCLVGYPYTSNIAESWARHNPAVDRQGNFYIVDGFNNRVLKFNQPLSADKTGGKGDNVADFVIGQDDFTQNGRNKGTIGVYGTISPPDNQSLYTMSSSFGWTCCGGVSVDTSDNVWVTDAGNARVLRFPQGSKTADLVIGQPDFTQNGADCSRALNKFCLPVLAKVDPETGDLYVLEMYNKDLFEVRILVFHAPFTNGMSAARTIIANQGPTFFWRGLPAFHFQATGFEFNPLKAGPYSAGKLWVNEHETFRTVLLKDNGDVVTAIGAPNATHIGGDSAFPGCNDIYLNFRLWGPGGAIGFDADNNIYLADERFHRLARYRLPYTLTTSETGRVCPPDPSGGLFPGTNPNVNVLDYTEPAVSAAEDNKLGEAIGLAVFNNQLIVHDEQRLKVWNDYLNKPMGAAPDIVVSSPPGTPTLPNRNLLSSAIDDHNRLWLLNENSKIRIYQLPFAGGDRPIADNLLLYWSDDPGAVVGGTGIRGWDNNSAGALTFDPINKKMYVMDYVHNRVLRIADHNNYGTKLLVDMVLGQPDKDHRLCNNNEIDDGDTTAHYPRADTMCLPSLGKFDNLGNLYVIENSYECHGNHRIIEFDAANLSSARGLFPNLSANRVFVADDFTHRGPCTGGVPNGPGSPVSIAFNSSNQMIVGNDGYFDADPGHREYRQLWIYNNPLIKQTADGYIPLPIGATGEIVFDSFNNLIVQDHTWSRVWAINPSLDPALAVSITGTPIIFPSPVALPTAVPTSIITPILSPTSTPTLTPAPTTAPLIVNCTVLPNPTAVGQTVIWTAHPSGGTGIYSYRWQVEAGLSNLAVTSANNNPTIEGYYFTPSSTDTPKLPMVITVTSGSKTTGQVLCPRVTVNLTGISVTPTLSLSPTSTPTLTPTPTLTLTSIPTPSLVPVVTSASLAGVSLDLTGTLYSNIDLNPSHTPVVSGSQISEFVQLNFNGSSDGYFVPINFIYSPPVITSTPTPTSIFTPTLAPTFTPAPTLTPVPIFSPSPIPTITPTLSPTPVIILATLAPTSLPTAVSTFTPTLTLSPAPTFTPSALSSSTPPSSPQTLSSAKINNTALPLNGESISVSLQTSASTSSSNTFLLPITLNYAEGTSKTVIIQFNYQPPRQEVVIKTISTAPVPDYPSNSSNQNTQPSSQNNQPSNTTDTGSNDLNNQPSNQTTQPSSQSTQQARQNSQSSNTINTNSYDLNGDGKINSLDFTILFREWRNHTKNSKADLNHDGVINSLDYGLLRKTLGG